MATPTDDDARAIALTADGHLVVAGSTSSVGPSAEANFAVARYGGDGTLDPNFGRGRSCRDRLRSRRPRERYRAAPRRHRRRSRREGELHAFAADRARAVRPDGTLDSAFGGGKRLVGPGIAVDVLEQADTKLLVAGGAIAGEFGPSGAFLRRYDARGVLDATYGVGGGVVVDRYSEYAFAALAFDRSHRAVVVGTAAPSGGFLLARFTKNGDGDAGFGGHGVVQTDFDAGDAGQAVAVGGDGKIVAAGIATSQGSRNRIALARYLPTYCVVPRVTGKLLLDAKRTIARAHCTVGKIRRAYSRTAAKDRVVAQSPAAGARLAESSRVNVTASRGRRG